MNANINDFQYTVSADHIVINRYVGEAHRPEIPAMIDGLPVKELGKYSFAGTDVECITIPEGIEHICENAFATCENLMEVMLPASLVILGEAVFQGCECLKTIKISGNSSRFAVYDGALYDTLEKALILCPPGLHCEHVQVKPGTKIIANAAFFQNGSLEYVELPLSLTKIEANAFLFTNKLPFISIPPSVNSIDESAFLIGPLQMRGKQFKLYCFKDSYGYQYAIQQGIPVETLYAYVTDSGPEVTDTKSQEKREITGNTVETDKEKGKKNSFWKWLFR